MGHQHANQRQTPATRWLILILCFAFALSGSAQDVAEREFSEKIFRWAMNGGPEPTRTEIEAILVFDDGFIAEPRHAAALGFLYKRGISGLFGRNESRGEELLSFAARNGNAVAQMNALAAAIDDRAMDTFDSWVATIERTLAAQPELANTWRSDRFRSSKLLLYTLDWIDGNPDRAKRELIDWYENERSAHAAIALCFLIANDVDLPYEFEHLATRVTEVWPRTGNHFLHLYQRSLTQRLANPDVIQQAHQALRTAAEHNSRKAIEQLAFELWDGTDFVEQDRSAAVYWLAKLVYLDNERAAILLAQAWLTGEGCAPNRDAALALLRRYSSNQVGGLWEGADADAIEAMLAIGPPDSIANGIE